MHTTRNLTDAHTWGLRFTDAESIDHVADALLEGFRGKPNQLPLVVTPNVDILVTLEDADSSIVDTVERAAVVLADGQPLVSFSHLAGDRLAAKLAGSDLTAVMWPQLALSNRSTFAVCARGHVGKILEEGHRNFSWMQAPMLPADAGSVIDAFAWDCIQQMWRMDEIPEFVFLGLGFPKDILVARSILEQWPDWAGEPPVILAVGASLEFIAGVKKRAPKVFQQLGIEFVHRILSEPRRMAHRYLVKDSRFLVILGRHVLS